MALLQRITRTRAAVSESRVKRERVDIVGPVCETRRLFSAPIGAGSRPGRRRAGHLDGGGWVLRMSLASNYNGRPRCQQMPVEGKKARLIRRRETNRDLLRANVLA